MTFRRLTALILALALLLLVGCGTAPQGPSEEDIIPPSDQDETPSDKTEGSPSDESTPTNPTPTNPTPKPEDNAMKKSYSILFIGNSYTYYNDMPAEIFKKIAVAAGYDVEVTAITKGSHKLSEFADPTDNYGAKVERALTSGKKYDYVVLQEQSVRPASDDAPLFFEAVRSLTARVREANTWGADIFLSLHTNAATNSNATGSEALIYSNTSTTARELAEDILDEMTDLTGLRNRGVVERPGLYVLRRTNMPAILVELGFITNPNDAYLMATSPDLFAEGIYRGFLDYYDL